MDKKAFQYDYYGEFDPNHNLHPYARHETFSVGIFQWLPKSNGKGLKKSAVIKRIRGLCSNPQDVYDKAKNLCQDMQKSWDHRAQTVYAQHDGHPRSGRSVEYPKTATNSARYSSASGAPIR